MGKIKPARVVTPRIVQPRSGPRTWLWLLFLAALAAWSWQVYDFGRQQGGFRAEARDQVEADLLARIARLEQEREALRAAAARFERAGQIDRAAADGVKSQVLALEEERAELRRQVAFLKTLVSGGEGAMLVLDDHNLTRVGERSYRFEVTLSKETDDDETVVGQVLIRIAGEADGATRKLDMEAFTDGKRTNIGIKFRNYQKLRADIELPDGFEPASIEVAVKPDGKSFKALEQAYDWKLSDA